MIINASELTEGQEFRLPWSSWPWDIATTVYKGSDWVMIYMKSMEDSPFISSRFHSVKPTDKIEVR